MAKLFEPEREQPPAPRSRLNKRLVFTTFALLLLLATASLWFAWRWANGRREQQAVQSLRGMAGYDTSWTGAVDGLHLREVGDDELAALGQLEFSNLRLLQLSECTLTPGGLRHLSGLTELVELNLWDSSFTDEAVPVLAEMRRLRRIHLTGTEVTFEGVKQLQEALPHAKIFD